MRYPELRGKCKNCIYGCNLLGEPFFTGKTECENYIGEETGLEKCWKILKGEQLKL